jgi:hypothetical protein
MSDFFLLYFLFYYISLYIYIYNIILYHIYKRTILIYKRGKIRALVRIRRLDAMRSRQRALLSQ